MDCPKCGKEIETPTETCSNCGESIGDQNNSNIFSQRNTNMEQLRLFVGDNADYYLKKWENIEEKRESWNWAGFLGGIFWMGYRKMYLYVIITLGIFLVLDAVIPVSNLDPLFSLIFALLIGLNGNYLYYLHANNKLRRINELFSDPEHRKIAAFKTGGPSWLGVASALIFIIVYAVIATQLMIAAGKLP